MSLLAMIMGAVMSWGVLVYWSQPLDEWLVPQIRHVWYSKEDERQQMVQYAYSLGGLPFVIMIECESAWRPFVISSTNDYGICQLHYKYNKEFINSEEYKDVYKQLDYCYEKWKINPKLWYWPNRKIKGQTCKEYVKNRFIFE